MKSLLYGTLLLTMLTPTAASAAASTGVSGTVFDAVTQQPLAEIAVALEPYDGSSDAVNVVSSKRGFFVRLGLLPGRYAISAKVAGRTSTCSVADVSEGQMRRVDVFVSLSERDVTCSSARPPGSLVDPDESADVYRIH